MNSLATPNALSRASNRISYFVDRHESTPYSNEFGKFLVCRASLKNPRIIEERTANFLRLFKGLGGNTLVGATYSELGLEPDPVTDVAREMPIRHVMIRADEPSTYIFNGTFDAREYSLPEDMLQELLEDVENAD